MCHYKPPIYFRRVITAASINVLLAAALIIALFIMAAPKVEDAWPIGLLFVGLMGAIIFSLVSFLQGLNESLLAFKLDIGMAPETSF